MKVTGTLKYGCLSQNAFFCIISLVANGCANPGKSGDFTDGSGGYRNVGGEQEGGDNGGGGSAGGTTVSAQGGSASSGGQGGTKPGSAGAGGTVSALPVLPDAGSADAAMTPPPPTGVPVFIAQGSGGRIMASCDNGRTWPFHQPGNGQTGDHSQWASHGIAYGNNILVGAFGWGTDVLVRVSRNGQDWTEHRPGAPGFSDIVFSGGMFVAGTGHLGLNSVDGKTWSRPFSHGNFEANGEGIIRGYGFGSYAGKPVFVGSGASRYVYSLDGKTWGKGSGPSVCGDNIDHIAGEFLAGPGDALFAVTSRGNVCRSLDGGKTYEFTSKIDGNTVGNVLFVNDTLFAFQSDQVSQSSDGVKWTARKLLPANTSLSLVARADSGPNKGSWVAANRDGSKLYYSADGLTWTAAAGGRAGASLSTIIAGFVESGGACP
jgi:hypothetical protein